MHDYFEVEVSLREVEPRIWRRFLIQADATFQDLHDAIQAAAGWLDCHLFVFRDAETGVSIAGIPEDDWGEPDPDAARVKVASWFGDAERKTCIYEYDFGDSWEHVVTVTRAQLPDSFERRFLGGARAFPHEDSGGIGGYERYCKVVLEGVDPWNEPIEDSLEWLEGWHPDKFDLSTSKKAFDKAKTRARASKPDGRRPGIRTRKKPRTT